MFLCRPDIVFLGHRLMINGREPDQSKVQRILDWPPCRDVHEVRGFLGTCGVLRIFIQGYAQIAKPLTDLTRKHLVFDWTPEAQAAMDALKIAVTTCPALSPLDYESDEPIVISIDSSVIGVGWIIGQENPDGH